MGKVLVPLKGKIIEVVKFMSEKYDRDAKGKRLTWN